MARRRTPLRHRRTEARFYLRGINLENPATSNQADLTTTNGIEVTIGDVMPPNGVSSVVSEHVMPGVAFPAAGRIVVGGGPVIRFVLQ